LISDINSYF